MLTFAYAAVVLFSALYFFRPQEFFPMLALVPMAKISGLVAGAALVGAILSEGARLRKEAKVLLLLFGYLCLTVPFSTWPGGSFTIAVEEFSKVAVIAIATMLAAATPSRLRRLMLLQALAMMTLGTLSIIHTKRAGRMFGVGSYFYDPNDFALNLCIVLPICVAMLLSSRRTLPRLFWLGAVGFLLLLIISTYSRGGFLALMAVTIAIWRRFRVSNKMIVPVLFLMSIFSCVAIFVAGTSGFVDRMSTIVNTEQDQTGSAEARRSLLIKSLELSLRHPLFGVGPGEFREVTQGWQPTHNSYTQLSSEAGIPSLILFLILLVQTFKNLRTTRLVPSGSQMWYLSNALYCSMVGYVVGAFFLTTAYLMFPYLLMAYASAAAVIAGDLAPPTVVQGGPTAPVAYF